MAAANTTSHTQRKANWKKLGLKVCLAAALIAAGYGAWLLIPLVVGSDLAPHTKTMLIATLVATLCSPNSLPLLSLAKRQSTF